MFLFLGEKICKRRDPTTFHLPPSPTKAYLHPYQWALVLLAQECEKGCYEKEKVM
jgi:hypothetical protein